MLWVDVLYEKIRYGQQVQNMAVLMVIGLDDQGRRDILVVEPMLEEAEATYRKLFEDLKERGLQAPWLVISDAHKGLVDGSMLHKAGKHCIDPGRQNERSLDAMEF